MERRTPMRNPHTSTADLLSWSEPPAAPAPAHAPVAAAAGSRSNRTAAPRDGVSAVVFGGQITEGESESLNKGWDRACHGIRRTCSGSKFREMTGSGIFEAEIENDASESSGAFTTQNNKTGLLDQPAGGPSETMHSEDPVKLQDQKPLRSAKPRKTSGSNIFGDEPVKLRDQKPLRSAKPRKTSGSNIFGDGEAASRDYHGGGGRKPPGGESSISLV